MAEALELFSKVFELVDRAHELSEQIEHAERPHVVNIPLPPGEGVDGRFGFPLFDSDSVFADVVAQGKRPLFPEQHDVPCNMRMSWDAFYVPSSPDGSSVHRITCTRAHDAASGALGVFIDGRLAFVRVLGKFQRSFLFDAPRWQSSGTEEGEFCFNLDGRMMELVPNSGVSVMKSLWAVGVSRMPHAWGLFADGHCVLSGESKVKAERRRKCCPGSLPMLILWPFYAIWVLLSLMVASCFFFGFAKCQVRKFHVHMSPDGKMRQEGEAATETQKLLD